MGANEPVELAVARLCDARSIEVLLSEYLRELSEHREVPVGATDSAAYQFFDAYWSEPGRHPFLVRRGTQTAGFAFVRDPASTRSGRFFRMAPLFIGWSGDPQSTPIHFSRMSTIH